METDAKEEKPSVSLLAPGMVPAGTGAAAPAPDYFYKASTGTSTSKASAPPAPAPAAEIARHMRSESKENKHDAKAAAGAPLAAGAKAGAGAGACSSDTHATTATAAESKLALALISPISRIEGVISAHGDGGVGVARLVPSGTPRARTFLVTTRVPEEPQVWDADTYKSLPKSGDGRQLRTTKISLPVPDPIDTVPWEVTWRETRLPVVLATRKGLLEPSVHTASVIDKIHAENESVMDLESVASLLDIVQLGAIKDTDEYGYVGQVNPEWKPHGDGIFLWQDNSRYEGMWEDGMRHGYGIMRWPSGDTYAGYWEQDRQIGEGQTVYATDYGPPGFEVFVAGRVYHRDPQDVHHQHSEGNNYIGERCGKTENVNTGSDERALVINSAHDLDVEQDYGTMAADRSLGSGRGGSVASNATSITLRGQLFEGVREGMGRCLYKNGDYYNGQWVNDKRTGMGRLDFKCGDCYVGEFHQNRRDGHGMCTYSNGCTYDGSWIEDQRNGHGIEWFASGDRYEGTWENDQMHGYGVYTWANGETYKGDYVNGMRHGIGKADYLDGAINQGAWEKDVFLGKKFKPDYDYVGEYNMTLNSYLYAKKHGFGRKAWKDGTKRIYDGQWEGDQMAGYCKAQVNFDGIGSLYTGQLIADGVKHGAGKFTASNGDVYDGQWSHGKKHGNGSITYAKTGDVFRGKWFNNQCMRRGGSG